MTEPRGMAGGSGRDHGVSAEVWTELEPAAAAATSLERRALLVAALVVGLLAVVLSGAEWAGLAEPRLGGGNSSGSSADPSTRLVRLDFELHNEGLAGAHVVGWRSTLDGVTVASGSPTDLRVPAHQQAHVRLDLHAADCHVAVPAAHRSVREDGVDGYGIGVLVARPWGTTRATVKPPGGIAEMILTACGVGPATEVP